MIEQATFDQLTSGSQSDHGILLLDTLFGCSISAASIGLITEDRAAGNDVFLHQIHTMCHAMSGDDLVQAPVHILKHVRSVIIKTVSSATMEHQATYPTGPIEAPMVPDGRIGQSDVHAMVYVIHQAPTGYVLRHQIQHGRGIFEEPKALAPFGVYHHVVIGHGQPLTIAGIKVIKDLIATMTGRMSGVVPVDWLPAM